MAITTDTATQRHAPRGSSRALGLCRPRWSRGFDRPLVVKEQAIPAPGPGKVLVKIETSGLCHTDSHAAKGHWPIKPKLPFIPGHEGVGIVTLLGPGVTNVKESDRVGLPWLRFACGECEFCATRGRLCASGNSIPATSSTAATQYAVACARYVGKVPDSIDPLDAAPADLRRRDHL